MFHHVGTQRLQTERMILRRYVMGDAVDMFDNWVTDREAIRFWGWDAHENIEETRAILRSWIEDYQKPDNYHWVIQSKASGRAIGYIYLNEMDEHSGSCAVHFLLSRKHWGQGLMTEACGKVVSFAFEEAGARKVATRHHELNLACGRVLQKCGFRYTRSERRTFKDCPQIDGIYLFYEIEASGRHQ